jgi:hypothetical protein
MRIAYLTTDEVNKGLALRLAAQWEVTVCPLEPRDPPPDDEFDAVLYDWDHWPADQRPKVPSGASAGPGRRPVALHGYGLDRQSARDLRRSGILVFDRLEPRTLLELQRAVNPARALQEPGESLDFCGPGDTALPCVPAALAEAEPQRSGPPCNRPSSCQPGYTIKLDPPLPSPQLAQEGRAHLPLTGGTGLATSRRRKVYRNRCLRCQRKAEGMDYPFAVAQRHGPDCRLVQEQKAFICSRCAEERLRGCAWLVLFTCYLGPPGPRGVRCAEERLRGCAWLVLFTWVPLGLAASGGVLTLALRAWLYANPFRRGHVPTVAMLLLLSLGLLVVTGLAVRFVWRHLRWVNAKGYQYEPSPDPAVTRMAIELRKNEILSRLPLPESSMRFLTLPDRWELTKHWR